LAGQERGRKEEKRMADDADLFCVSTRRSSNCSSPLIWKAIPVGLAVAAFALAGCNANQGVNVSGQSAPGVAPGPYFPGYNPYDPVHYAQTSGFYGGR